MIRGIAFAGIALLTAFGCSASGADHAESGSGILLGVDGGGYGEIWLLDEHAGEIRRLVSREPESIGVGTARWSPDGTRIAYVGTTYGEREFEVYVADPDGSEARQLTDNDVPEFQLAWSPDGERIAVSRELDWNTERWRSAIVVIDLKRRKERLLFEGRPRDFLAGLSWLPDGREIAFASYGPDESSPIHIVDVATGVARSFVEDVGWPAWSPDGRQIAFVRQSGLYVADANGENERLVTTVGSAPAWSPDGTEIAFVTDDGVIAEVLAAPAAGGPARSLWSGRLHVGELDWR